MFCERKNDKIKCYAVYNDYDIRYSDMLKCINKLKYNEITHS